MDLILLCFFGALGGIVRASADPNVMWGILGVNMVGSLMLGWLDNWTQFSPSGWLAQRLRFGLGAGFIGSMTTFSTYILVTNQLFHTQALIASGYLILVPTAGVLLAWIGERLSIIARRSRRRLREHLGQK